MTVWAGEWMTVKRSSSTGQAGPADPKEVLPGRLKDAFDSLASRYHVHILQRVMNPAGDINYSYASPNVATLFGTGADSDDFRRREPDHHWIHPLDRQRFLNNLRQSARQLSIFDEEVRVFAADERIRWVRSIGYPRQTDDGSVVWDGIAIDVTDHHAAMALVRDAVQSTTGDTPEIEDLVAEMARMQERMQYLQTVLHHRRTQVTDQPGLPSDASRTTPPESDGQAGSDAGDRSGETGQRLTPRQIEILHLVRDGLSNSEIADRLGLTPGTVKVHLSAIYRSIGVRNRTAAARALNGNEKPQEI